MSQGHNIRIDISPGPAAIHLLAAGDVCVQAADIESANGKISPDSIFDSSLRELLADKTISIVNLECPVSQLHSPILKSGPNLAGDPRVIDVLRAGHFDIAGLANNHMLDHGPAAMFATADACEKAGMRIVGIGRDIEDSLRPLILEFEGFRIAILALGEEEFSGAGRTRPGVAPLNAITAAQAIANAKLLADVIIVFAHGGREYYPLPTPRVQELYRFMVACGAHAVIGHHPHTVQGVEVYQGRPILYSLGNFLFPQRSRTPSCWDTGIVARLSIGRNGVQAVELFATLQSRVGGVPHVRQMDAQGFGTFEQMFDRMSRALLDPNTIEQCWQLFCCDSKRGNFGAIKSRAGVFRGQFMDLLKTAIKARSPSYAIMAAADLMDRWLPNRRRSHDQAAVWNLLHCPTHHELMTTCLAQDLWPDQIGPAARELYDELMPATR